MKKFISLIMLLYIWFIPFKSFAIYKWVDEDGVVHFSDTPPPEKKEVTEIMKEFHRLKGDEFDDGKIWEKWMTLNKGNGSFDEEKNKGFLTIEAKAKANIWTDGVFSPVIYQRVNTKLNFTVETRMEYQGDSEGKAGIFIYSIFSNAWIMLMREGNKVYMVVSSDSKNYNEMKKGIPSDGVSSIILKMEKKGMLLTSSFSLNGTDWLNIGDTELRFDNYMNIGLFAASWGDKPVSAKFDYFRVY